MSAVVSEGGFNPVRRAARTVLCHRNSLLLAAHEIGLAPAEANVATSPFAFPCLSHHNMADSPA